LSDLAQALEGSGGTVCSTAAATKCLVVACVWP